MGWVIYDEVDTGIPIGKAIPRAYHVRSHGQIDIVVEALGVRAGGDTLPHSPSITGDVYNSFCFGGIELDHLRQQLIVTTLKD
jgi:hypothetical protein